MGIPHDMPVNLYVIRGVDTAVNVYPSIRFAIAIFGFVSQLLGSH